MTPRCHSLFSVSASLHFTSHWTQHAGFLNVGSFPSVVLHLFLNQLRAQSCFCKMQFCSYRGAFFGSFTGSAWFQLHSKSFTSAFFVVFKVQPSRSVEVWWIQAWAFVALSFIYRNSCVSSWHCFQLQSSMASFLNLQHVSISEYLTGNDHMVTALVDLYLHGKLLLKRTFIIL